MGFKVSGVSLLSVLLLSGLGTSAGINYVVKFSSDIHLEKDTQASTGQTTGIWLVHLYTPGCRECSNINKLLDQAAAAETSSVLFSKVDCSMSPDVSKRFGVTEYPHLMLFKNRKMHVYEGPVPVTMESLMDFAENSGALSDGVPVPEPLGWKEYMEEFMAVFSGLLEENPSAVYAYWAGGAMVALVIISTIVSMIFPRGKVSSKED